MRMAQWCLLIAAEENQKSSAQSNPSELMEPFRLSCPCGPIAHPTWCSGWRRVLISNNSFVQNMKTKYPISNSSFESAHGIILPHMVKLDIWENIPFLKYNTKLCETTTTKQKQIQKQPTNKSLIHSFSTFWHLELEQPCCDFKDKSHS